MRSFDKFSSLLVCTQELCEKWVVYRVLGVNAVGNQKKKKKILCKQQVLRIKCSFSASD